MARLELEETDLRVHLSWAERAMAFSGDVTVPLTSIVRVTVAASPWVAIRGWRVTGTGIPGYVAFGRRRHGSGYDFTAVHNRRDEAVLVECNAGRYEQVLVSVADAAGWATRIARAAGIAG